MVNYKLHEKKKKPRNQDQPSPISNSTTVGTPLQSSTDITTQELTTTVATNITVTTTTVETTTNTTTTVLPPHAPEQAVVGTEKQSENEQNPSKEETKEFTEQQMNIIKEGQILQSWIMDEAASQLTYYGMIELHQQVKENELAVFFRNNHFSTLFKTKGQLYLLVTDQGYLTEKNVIWEVLNEIDGDTQWVDSNFNLYRPTLQDTVIHEFDPSSPDPQGLRASQQLALKLQEEEDKKFARQIAQTQPVREVDDYSLALRLQQQMNAEATDSTEDSDERPAVLPAPVPVNTISGTRRRQSPPQKKQIPPQVKQQAQQVQRQRRQQRKKSDDEVCIIL